MAGTPRGQEGGARRGNATTTTSQHDKRTRGGQCNKRTMRYDDATTSWRNKMARGQHDEMTRQREGGVSRGIATTSQRNERRTRGQRRVQPDKSICQHGLLLPTTTRRATRQLLWRGQSVGAVLIKINKK